MNDNNSWNCGAEGPTDDPAVLGLRNRQARNLMVTLLLSQGVPMILAGDEFLRTQGGNNNAWCQDNEIGWIDWSLAGKNSDFHRFTREMIWLRRRHPVLRRRSFFRGRGPLGTLQPDVVWHGTEPNQPDFGPFSKTLAFSLDGRMTGREPDRDFYVAFNSWREPLAYRIPPSPSGRPWRRVVDTALAAPLDFAEEGSRPLVPANGIYLVAPHASVILISDD